MEPEVDMGFVLTSAGLALAVAIVRGPPEEVPARTTEPMLEGWSPPPPSPSPRLGWLILAVVVIVVGLGGWWVMDTLDGRAWGNE